MLVYTFDYATGAFAGSRILTATDCDPRSPGTILLPGNATKEEPPRCGSGLWPFWRNGRWEVMEEVIVPDPPSLDPYFELHSIE